MANVVRIDVDAHDNASKTFGLIEGKAKLMGAAVVAAGAAATAAFGAFVVKGIGLASDFEESLSKVNVVFGQQARTIEEWSRSSAQDMGIAQGAALEAAGTFGNLFTAMGLTQQAAADMSPQIIQLAADLASFNNASPEETLIALRSGLVGEIEPLRRFGVAINAATVEAKALELGLAATKAEISEADKVTARYQLILEQTANAQGDFARTSDNYANQMRTLRANIDNLAVTIGQSLLPEVTRVVDKLNEMFEQNGEEWAAAIGESLSKVADAIGFALARLTDFVHGLQIIDAFIKGGGAGVQDLLRNAGVPFGLPGVGTVGPSPIFLGGAGGEGGGGGGGGGLGDLFGPFRAVDPTRPAGPGNPAYYGGGRSRAGGVGGAASVVDRMVEAFDLTRDRALALAQKGFDELRFAAEQEKKAREDQIEMLRRETAARGNLISALGGSGFQFSSAEQFQQQVADITRLNLQLGLDANGNPLPGWINVGTTAARPGDSISIEGVA